MTSYNTGIVRTQQPQDRQFVATKQIGVAIQLFPDPANYAKNFQIKLL
jgi:hypothetical protein